MRGLTPDDASGPDEPPPGDGPPPPELAGVLARLTDASTATVERGRLLGRAAGLIARSTGGASAAALAGGRLLGDLLLDVAPHLPVRDAATLSSHHDGLTGNELAEALIRAASLATAAVGGAGGAVHAVSWTAPPALLAAPLTLVAETLAVVTVEVKLVAELHEVYGRAVQGSGTDRAVAYVTAWVRRRGVDPLGSSAGLGSLLGAAAKAQLRKRLLRRLGRNLSTLAPVLAGVVAGAELNRRETRRLGEAVAVDLRRR